MDEKDRVAELIDAIAHVAEAVEAVARSDTKQSGIVNALSPARAANEVALKHGEYLLHNGFRWNGRSFERGAT